MSGSALKYREVNGDACLAIAPTRHVPDLREDARNGLLSRPRHLPPKYFYDERGAELFARICSTPEYYPMRMEEALLSTFSADIIDASRPKRIIELGSGNSHKTRHLFNACERHGHRCQYVPFDVCEPVLNQAAARLKAEYHWLEVMPLLGDYHAGLDNIPTATGCNLFVFLGSTIGNFTPREAADFTKELHTLMQTGDYFLIGADRVKNAEVLEAAYNDEHGITAEFNLNILRVLNRRLGANFDLNNFSHDASFNKENSRVEMYVTAKKKQHVYIADLDEHIELDEGEKILTEISYKFSFKELESLLTATHFTIVQHYQPSNQYFSLVLAQL